MILPPVIRIFFAIDLRASVKDEIGKFIGGLKKKSKSRSIRWTKPENMHITLHFLAEVQADHVDSLLKNVRQRIGDAISKTSLHLGTIQLFPSPFRPRVIVLEVTPKIELEKLFGLIGEGITAATYEIERRPYRPHLTLGRLKHTHGVNLEFLSDCKLPEIEIEVDEVVLFRSEPQEDGSKYTVLEKIALGTHTQ